MSFGILGNKIGMTQVFDKKGNLIPVTVIKGGPCYVTQIKSTETCGYNAIQLGYIELSTKSKLITKPLLGHFNKFNLKPFQYLKEFKVIESDKYKIGDKLTVDIFELGQKVTISGLTIGKGNTGNIKKHGFNRGAMSHGSKHHRLQGSLGAGTSPGRVFPGKRMPGRLGMDKRTITGLEILDIDPIENIILVKGSIPGKSGNLLTITSKN